MVGQIYMGYVKEELAEPGQDVKGVIIALDEDLRLKRALSVTNNIEITKLVFFEKVFINRQSQLIFSHK